MKQGRKGFSENLAVPTDTGEKELIRPHRRLGADGPTNINDALLPDLNLFHYSFW